MAFELYGMLAGNVSPMTGENIKPAYGGDEEAFLRKVVTPIYDVIKRVKFLFEYLLKLLFLLFSWLMMIDMFSCRKLTRAKKSSQSIHIGGIMMI